MIEEPIDQIQASGYVPVLFDPQFPTMLCYVNQRGNFFFFFETASYFDNNKAKHGNISNTPVTEKRKPNTPLHCIGPTKSRD